MIVDSWDNKLEQLSVYQKDIYFSEAYCKLYNSESRKARAFIYEKGSSIYILPFMLGKIPYTNGLSDFETPYGYGGPITNDPDPQFLHLAEQALAADCWKEGIIAGFIRFHPILGNQRFTSGLFNVIPDRLTVAIDLTVSEEEIWQNQLHSKNRNTIRKANNSGLKFYQDESFEHLDQFIELYNQTMYRVGADDFYHFGESYFKSLAADLIGKAFLGEIYTGEELVAAAIFMHDGLWGHYHLAGSKYEWAKMGANNLLVYEAALALKRKEAKKFHLGGGTDSSPDNSLLAFKKKFSNNFYQFSIGKCVFLDKEYEKICKNWAEKFPDKQKQYGHLVLKYRY